MGYKRLVTIRPWILLMLTSLFLYSRKGKVDMEPINYQQKIKTRKEFLDQLFKIGEEFYKLLLIWEKLDSEENGMTSELIPFNESFDEFYHNWYGWARHLVEKMDIKTDDFSPTTTVGDLKKIIEVLDDDVQLVIAKPDEDGWWLNIDEVELPDNEGMFTLTLHTKNNFDPRQF